jgi:hypothetical protein
MAPFAYRAFGLTLVANREIGGLPERDRVSPPASELRVWFGERPPRVDDSPSSPVPWYVSPYRDAAGDPLLTGWEVGGGAYLQFRYTDGAVFTFDRGGDAIWVEWREPLTFDDAVSYLLGPMMGLALRFRGVLCLHASAVAIDDHIVAIMGQEGAGKSTTATAFAELGYPIVSDDLVPLFERDDRWFAHPAYPRLRLWPSSVELMAHVSDRFPQLPADWGVRRYYVDFERHAYRFASRAMPLGAVYLLDRRVDDPDAPLIDAVPPQDTMMTLVANTFAARALDATMRAREFAQVGRLVDRVPVRRVRPHSDPARLPRLCEAIADDLQRVTAVAAR